MEKRRDPESRVPGAESLSHAKTAVYDRQARGVKVFIDRQRGKWYKGNLHAHSVLSDGKLTPPEVRDLYSERGYSFLAFSEHQRYTFHSDLEKPGFIILPAVERNKSFGEPRRYFHINGILGPRHLRDMASRAPLKHLEHIQPPDLGDYTRAAQDTIDELRESGHLVMFNHPQWSFNSFEDFLSLDGYFAIEIFNYTSEVETGNGLSTVHWDAALRAGRRVWGVASDDNHNRNKYGEAPPEWDSFGGWVMVNTHELSHDAITTSLMEGNFYSSSGPEIHCLYVDENHIHVDCSPVQRVYFMTYFRHGYSRRAANGGSIESADYELRGDEMYVRIECVDETGGRAWSNPVFFDGVTPAG